MERDLLFLSFVTNLKIERNEKDFYLFTSKLLLIEKAFSNCLIGVTQFLYNTTTQTNKKMEKIQTSRLHFNSITDYGLEARL